MEGRAAARGKKENIFAFKKRGKRSERKGAFLQCLPGLWLEIEGSSSCFER